MSLSVRAKEAKEYLKYLFDHFSELSSCWHEVTDNGVFTVSDIDNMSDTELINVSEDIRYNMRLELGIF